MKLRRLKERYKEAKKKYAGNLFVIFDDLLTMDECFVSVVSNYISINFALISLEYYPKWKKVIAKIIFKIVGHKVSLIGSTLLLFANSFCVEISHFIESYYTNRIMSRKHKSTS